MSYRIPLALAILLSALFGVTGAASAQTSGPGSCPGRLIDVREIVTSGTVIAEAAVYYDRRTGKNCLRLNRRGPAVGRASWMYASLTACEDTNRRRVSKGTASFCDRTRYGASFSAADYGVYRQYAGPVSVYAPRNCVQVVTSIKWGSSYSSENFVTGCPVRG